MLVALALIVSAVGLISLASGADDPGYRLRAETLLPTDLSVHPDDVACPEQQGPSPVEYVETGALANTLPVYNGDLIAARVLAIPDASSATVRFTATWPTTVVGEEQPSCIFVVGDGTDPARLSWEENGPASTAVELTNVSSAGTEVEFWLWADDPDAGTTFRTTIDPELSGDDIVINPAEGRVGMGRRRTSTPEVEVAAERAADSDRHIDVRATVTNPTPKSRALDVELRLDSPDGNWVPESGGGGECRGGASLVCPLGDLADDAVVEIAATLELEESWQPAAVACGRGAEGAGFGLCVNARAVSLQRSDEASSATNTLVQMPRPPTDGLTIRTDPAPVVARAGRPVEFDFTISSTGQEDLASVDVVGSDCTEVERVSQPLEDDDAFLEAGETWRYDCSSELRTSSPFRIDVTARDPLGNPVIASYEDAVRVIDPRLELTAVTRATVPTVRVTNIGTGSVRNLAFSAPGCPVIKVQDEQNVEVLDEGRSIVFECDWPDGDLTAAVAYGTDELELGVVGEWQ